jgi:hypothetical protein
MSEPYSAMAQFRISPAALGSYLEAPARAASGWPDWAGMCGRRDVTGEQGGLPFSLHGEMDFGSVDRWLSTGDYRSQLRDILGTAEVPSLARFDYGEDGLVTIVNLTVAAECFRGPLWFLAAIRAVADYVDGPGGLAVIRNSIWGAPGAKYTLAVLRLEPGGSRFLHSGDDAYSDAVRQAEAAFDSIGLTKNGPPPGDGEALANLDRFRPAP